MKKFVVAIIGAVLLLTDLDDYADRLVGCGSDAEWG